MNDQFFACIDNCGVTNPTPTLRHATPVDRPAIVGLIRELAAYEKLEYLVVATPESMHPHLFRRGTGARHAAQSHRRLTQGESPSCSALLGPTFGCPSVSDAMFRDDWQDGVMKHEATTARLDVLEAAVLALAEARPATHASAARSGLLQRVEDLSDPVAPAADAAAARTLAAVQIALSR